MDPTAGAVFTVSLLVLLAIWTIMAFARYIRRSRRSPGRGAQKVETLPDPYSMFTEPAPVAPYLSTCCAECDWSYSSRSYAALMTAKVQHHAEHTELY